MTFDTNSILSGQGLPTPTDTPTKASSRLTSRQCEIDSSSSPPCLPPLSFEDDQQQIKSVDEDNEEISPLDPRRFTPNLHASLVSQILSLQREVESKINTVNNLEEYLHMTKEENEQLSDSLSSERKETRSIRKQMQMLESTTLTALGDIAKERDEALETLTSTRKNLEASKSQFRSQDDDAQRTLGLWDREKRNWDMEKRNMETRVHLAEGRLKSVLAEIAAAQVEEHMYPRTSVVDDEGMRQTWYTKESDCTSTRSNSVKDRSRFSGQSLKSPGSPNFRASTLSGPNGIGMGNLNGISLAEELEFEQEAEEHEGASGEEVLSPDALPEEVHFHRRQASIQSLSKDQKAWKLLGLFTEHKEHPIGEEVLPEKVPALSLDNDTLIEKLPTEKDLPDIPEGDVAPRYMDSGTQYSPISSPKMESQYNPTGVEKAIEEVGSVEPTANQRRKRVSAPPMEQTSPAKSMPQAALAMVSSSCQTSERPPSPPLTPIIKIEPPAKGAISGERVNKMVSSSTQTNEEQEVAIVTAGGRQASSSMAIPVIEIHPPGSRPPSSHNSVVLPPRTKNAGCQANIQPPITTREASVQTEKIEVDKRPIDLPLRSLSATGSHSSLVKSGLERIEERVQPAPRRSSRRNVHRPPSLRPLIKPSLPTSVDAYPGNNDNGPLNKEQATSLRRPVRSESLFAGFDSTYGEDTLDLKKFDLSSDDDFATAPPIRKTLSKVQNSWKLVPQSSVKEHGLGSAGTTTDSLEPQEAFDPWLKSLVPEADHDLKHGRKNQEKIEPKLPILSSTAKQFHMIPAAPKTSKTSIRPPRTRSPSAPDRETATAAPPPFPVPTRSSSRKIPISVSEGAYSPTPQSSTFFSQRKADVKRPPTKNPLRKVRSAAAVTRFARNNGQPKTPQPMSPSTAPSESPQLPRMPRSKITSQHRSESQVLQTTHALPQASLEGDAAIETPGQQTSVVDAIAQTMVGEWMWKYVRRRKSFGVTDDVDFDEKGIGNGIRHKRWVWLAPYERAVMWSSKQPTSGPALLGKNGRKRKLGTLLQRIV